MIPQTPQTPDQNFPGFYWIFYKSKFGEKCITAMCVNNTAAGWKIAAPCLLHGHLQTEPHQRQPVQQPSAANKIPLLLNFASLSMVFHGKCQTD